MSSQDPISEEEVVSSVHGAFTMEQRGHVILALYFVCQQKVVVVDGRLGAVFASEMIVEFKPHVFLAAGASLASFGPIHPVVVMVVAILACLVEVLRPRFEILA